MRELGGSWALFQKEGQKIRLELAKKEERKEGAGQRCEERKRLQGDVGQGLEGGDLFGLIPNQKALNHPSKGRGAE